MTCNQTNSVGFEGTEQPPTDEEDSDEPDELDSVVLQLGKSLKELVLGIVKTVDEATGEN